MQTDATRLTSDELLTRPIGGCKRALYKSMGFDDEDLSRPLIGLAECVERAGARPMLNLRQVAQRVHDGVIQAGGMPVEFGSLAAAMAWPTAIGVRTSPCRRVSWLPTASRPWPRSTPSMAWSCSVPVTRSCGNVDGRRPSDIPAILLAGGPSEGGVIVDSRASDIGLLDEAVPRFLDGQMTSEQLVELESCVMPSSGSCSYLGTANSMCCLAEALGMSLPGSATMLATDAARARIAAATGRRIVELVREALGTRRIITRDSIENAIRVATAIGASTNVILHITAIASEAEVELGMEDIGRLCQQTPLLGTDEPLGPGVGARLPSRGRHSRGHVPAVATAARRCSDDQWPVRLRERARH